MTHITHQTVKLARGRHSSPHDGVCVMELASMLAGEPFTDHPRSVCPVIGAFLRSYNDAIDDRRRQDLYTYAAKVVGSRSTERVQRVRADRLVAWTRERRRRRWTRFVLPTTLWAPVSDSQLEFVGNHAVRALRRLDDETHREALALIDELLRIGSRDGVDDAATVRASRSVTEVRPEPAAGHADARDAQPC